MKSPRHQDHGPLPYSGQELERRARLGTPWTQVGYGHDQGDGHDQGGGREYRFNALGFRGPEFNATASHRVYGFGESHAFGYFVDAEQCWPARFASLWGAARGIAEDDLCFQNFADVGSSNSGIARAVVSQCSVAEPDLVLVHFSDHRRSDVYLDGEPYRVGPWLLDEATAQAVPEDEPLRSSHLAQIERAEHFYRYAVGPGELDHGAFDLTRDATCVEDTLRAILLVQYFCQARGIAALATCDLVESLFNDPVRANASLRPLLEQIDANFLTQLRIWNVEGDTADDAGHAGPVRHDRFARALLDIFDRSDRPSPPGPLSRGRKRGSQRVGGGPRGVGDLHGPAVQAFYDAQPFNFWGNVGDAVESVRDPDALDAYPDLKRLMAEPEVRSVVECGCGAGWLSNTLALHYDVQVTGIDFSTTSLERAREVARGAGVDGRVEFVEGDLTDPQLSVVLGTALDGGESFDLLVSLGVLHHTVDPRATCQRLLSLVPDGVLYLGLYHAPARRIFLNHLHGILASDGEAASFDEFCRLTREQLFDAEHVRSWFRDQVLHPMESQHTLAEVASWLSAVGWQVESTSINRFAPFDHLDEVVAMEEGFADRAQRALDEGRFLPGFFTVLARPQPG